VLLLDVEEEDDCCLLVLRDCGVVGGGGGGDSLGEVDEKYRADDGKWRREVDVIFCRMIPLKHR